MHFKILNDSGRSEAEDKVRKPNKIWVDKGSEFYNNFFKKWLQDKYSTHNEEKSVVRLKFSYFSFLFFLGDHNEIKAFMACFVLSLPSF